MGNRGYCRRGLDIVLLTIFLFSTNAYSVLKQCSPTGTMICANGFCATTAKGVCDAMNAANYLKQHWTLYFGDTCGSGSNSAVTNVVQSCPDGTPAKNGICMCEMSCASPLVWDDTKQQCVDKCSPMAGKQYGTNDSFMYSNNPSKTPSICVGQCELNYGGGSACSAGKTSSGAITGGSCNYYGPFTATGKSCADNSITSGGSSGDPDKDAGNALNKPKDASSCSKSGGYWGSVNGVDTCVPANSKSSESPNSNRTTQKTNSDGTKSESTENSKTSCADGVCSTTTTTTTTNYNSDGSKKDSSTSTDSKQQDQISFCKNNPGDPGCKQTSDSSFGGTCKTGFTCDGDAAQCATAKASWTSACALGNSDGSTLAEKIISGSDPALSDATTNPLVPKTQSIQQITPSRTLSAGCPADFSVSVLGKTETFSFSQVCPYLQIMGSILVGVAWISAFFIMSRSVR